MSGEDDPTGAEIADEAPDALGRKAELPLPRMAMLALVAGVLIGFGSIAFLVAQASAPPSGASQLLSGLAFSIGLMMVMVTGAELFTGNTMFALPLAQGRLGARRTLVAWGLVWTGNLVGALLLAGLFMLAGGADALDGAVGAAARDTLAGKLGKGVAATLASGVLANMLVCLAVWMAMGAKTLSGRLLAVAGPVAIVVAPGFEH
ncbi:MAG: formate/nitrite transporter family protein [Sphingomonas sp.]